MFPDNRVNRLLHAEHADLPSRLDFSLLLQKDAINIFRDIAKPHLAGLLCVLLWHISKIAIYFYRTNISNLAV